MKNQIKIITLLGMGFCFGLAAVVTNYTAQKSQRDPANAGSLMQISNLGIPELRNEILNRIKVHPTLIGIKKIELRDFSTSLCKEVNNIEFIFASEGVSVGGEPTRLLVSIPCEPGIDSSEIAPAVIPVGKLLADNPQNKSYVLPGNTVISLQNVADVWPTTWVLVQVDIHTSYGGGIKHITFDRSPASVNDQPPVVLEF